jgi:cytochrome c biogenesis protein CcdA
VPVLVVIFLITGPLWVTAATNEPVIEENILYYFWGNCPICSKPEDHVELFDDYPVEVLIYEVFFDEEGRNKYDQISEELGITAMGFPTLVYNDRYWLGFSQAVQDEIVETIVVSLELNEKSARGTMVNLPLVGGVDLQYSPILITTVVIALLDGFNPCSLFVLTFLLAIIIHSASRKRIFLVGITFLLVTASVYGLFILGILNVMIYASQLFWIRNLVAILVIIIGIFGLKDFFFYREGPTFSIPEKHKSRFYKQVRKIFYTDSVWPMLVATVAMGLGIALVELPCTAGFPFIWSSIISGMELTASYFIILFVLYIMVYLADELVIFFLALLKMRSTKISEEQGRTLKLLAGTIMIVMGLVLLFYPDLMENFTGILIAFGTAFLMAFLIYLLRKKLYRES